MFEYKVIPAPARVEKIRGLKTTAERFAHHLTQAINAEADEGWEYVRAETLPCEERKGILGGTRSTTETVLIFRRAIDWEEAEEIAELPENPRAARHEPAIDRREPLFRADAFARTATTRRAEPRLRAGDGEQ